MKMIVPFFMGVVVLFLATAFAFAIEKDPESKVAGFLLAMSIGCIWSAVKTAHDAGKRDG